MPVWGGSYWTSSPQYRALKAGAPLSRNIGRDSNALGYESHASMILGYLQVSHHHRRFLTPTLILNLQQTFRNEEEGYMSETTRYWMNVR